MDKIEDIDSIDENYLVLHRVLHDALDQAASGKGKDRHAMGEPFEEQLMCLLARQLGPQGPAFQVCKKVVEACRLPYPANVREVLGAINYAAGMVIVAPSPGRGLKLLSTSIFRRSGGVAPSPGRGLKRSCGASSEKFVQRRPFTGAWIETHYI